MDHQTYDAIVDRIKKKNLDASKLRKTVEADKN